MEQDRRRLEQLAFASLTEADCPPADQLAAFILNTLTSAEHLVVAAHIRSCQLCQRDIVLCRPPEPRRRIQLARPLPLVTAEGRRGDLTYGQVHRYVAGELAIDLMVAAPSGENWRVTGQVLRAGVELADRPILMRSGNRRYQQASDSHGFFAFTRVPAGRYTLSVVDEQIQVQIRNLILSLE